MASNEGPLPTGPIFRHVFPPSRESSKCTSQPSVLPAVLDGESHPPSVSTTGLFLIGPRMPSGKRSGFVQVLPASEDDIVMPHAAARFPGDSSIIVDAWHSGYGACSLRNSNEITVD